MNIPSYLLCIIKSFLTERSFQVRVNAFTSSICKTNAGVPQGSILGPTLFNIFMYDIPTTTNTDLAMYADDTAIITQDSDIHQAANNLQESVDELNLWFKKWHITINPNKCEAKIFTLRRPLEPQNIVINNIPIPWNPKDSAVRYLGIYLDRRLTWSYHINKKLSESYARLAILYPILNKKSSLKLKCGTLIYTAIIRPIFTYGCSVWYATSKTNLNKLQILQNKALRIITNAQWFVRNSQLHRETGIPTIEEYIRETAHKFYHNINQCSGARHYNIGNKSIHTRLKRKLPIDLLNSDSE